MKIAFVTQPWDEVIPVIGGHSSISILTYQLACRLTRSAEVVIYAAKSPSRPKVERDDDGIQYRRVSVATERRLLKPFKLFDRLPQIRNSKRPTFASSLYYLGYILQIAWDLKKQQADIIHIHNFSQFAPIIKAFNPHAKIVLHMHCEWLSQLDSTVIEKRLNQVDLVFGCSEYITDKVRNCFPQFADHCHTMFNGVDVYKFVGLNGQGATNTKNGKRIVYVGRVSPEKGIHVLLDAFQKVIEHYPQVQLDIVGPPGDAPFEFVVLVSDDDKVASLTSFYNHKLRHGNYFSYLQNNLSSKLVNHVNFVGSIPHSEVMDYYRLADLFIFPSVWDEPFGIPLVEAMACRVPVVATKGGGITEIVQDGKTGLLVERGDADALAKAMLQILSDDSLSGLMGESGRQRALELFSWDHVAEDLLHHYMVMSKSDK